MVIAAVGVDAVWTLAGAAAAAPGRRDRLDQRHELGDIVAVAAGQRHRQRDPCASVIWWCLEPGRARSTGLGPVLGHPSPPAHASCPPLPATSPAPPPRSAPRAAPRAAAATPRPAASRAAAARRSC